MSDKTIKPGDVLDCGHGLKGIATPAHEADGEYWELTRRCKSDERRRWRYEFAKAALEGCLANPEKETFADNAVPVAEWCINYADALLEKLESTDPNGEEGK